MCSEFLVIIGILAYSVKNKNTRSAEQINMFAPTFYWGRQSRLPRCLCGTDAYGEHTRTETAYNKT